MKPTREQVLQWMHQAANDYVDEDWPENVIQDFETFAAIVYAAGAAAMKERAARIADGWECEAAGGVYRTCGNGNFWDEGTIYDQGRADAAGAIRSLGDEE